VIHVDRPERDNLALDLLKVARSTIEAYVFDLLREKTFRRADFFEARDTAAFCHDSRSNLRRLRSVGQRRSALWCVVLRACSNVLAQPEDRQASGAQV